MKESGSGHQTTLTFLQTQKYFEILYERIKHRVLHEEIKTGLWMMISAMHERNYLHANDIYLRLAIGNSPWPIGVTSVGIHERSAREKVGCFYFSMFSLLDPKHRLQWLASLSLS